MNELGSGVLASVFAILGSATAQWLLVTRRVEQRDDVSKRREVYAAWILSAKSHLHIVQEASTKVISQDAEMQVEQTKIEIRNSRREMTNGWELILLQGSPRVIKEAQLARNAIMHARDEALGLIAGDLDLSSIKLNHWNQTDLCDKAFAALTDLINAVRSDLGLEELTERAGEMGE